jgi:hypothetical protein
MAQGAAPESWLYQVVHACIDAVASTLQRLLELPLIGVLACCALVAGLVLLGASRLGRTGRRKLAIALRACAVLLVVGGVLFALDQKLRTQAERLEALRQQGIAGTCGMLDTMQQRGLLRSTLLVDLAAARTGLERSFTGVELRAVVLDEATDLIFLHLGDPLVSGALAVIDLQSPLVALELGADFATKRMTSGFGSSRGCTVAINGEAGSSPQPNCGLGPWTGHFVVDGKTLLVEQAGNPRPFLCFDRQNRARFVASTSSSRAVGAEDHNVIWGRVDAIVDGVARTEAYRFNQPRTVMGIDREGQRLFLLVVDGRQPRHSWGFTHPQVAQFLMPFGVHDAMLCDEGGSACMYASAFGGLVTVPSDNQGEERPTYTHFGIRRRNAAVPKDH